MIWRRIKERGREIEGEREGGREGGGGEGEGERAGLTRSSNTSILFLPAKKSGLALPSLISQYKKLQPTKMVQLFTSRDQGVREAAVLRLAQEEGRQRMKFSPAALVDSIITQEPSQSRRAAAKTIIAEEDDEERHQALCQLPAQGEMARACGDTSQVLWARAVRDLPPEPMSFVLCASLDSLPTNANLHRWGKNPLLTALFAGMLGRRSYIS